jgi:hypothetical protein
VLHFEGLITNFISPEAVSQSSPEITEKNVKNGEKEEINKSYAFFA